MEDFLATVLLRPANKGRGHSRVVTPNLFGVPPNFVVLRTMFLNI